MEETIESVGPYRTSAIKEQGASPKKRELDFKCSWLERWFLCPRQTIETRSGIYKFKVIRSWGGVSKVYYSTKGNYIFHGNVRDKMRVFSASSLELFKEKARSKNLNLPSTLALMPDTAIGHIRAN